MNDNWEDLLNSDVVELKKNDDIKFGDEDKETEEKKEKNAEENTAQNESPPKENKKKPEKKKDLNEKVLAVNDPFGVPDRKAGNPKATYEDKKRGEIISKETDERNIEDLFGDLKFENKNIEDLFLKDENAHREFAKIIAKVLSRSNVKLHIVEFYKEILQALYSKFTAKEYQEINQKVTILFNQKQKEEKPQNTKKKATKPTLKATKADKNTIADDEDDFEEEEVAVAYQPKFNDDDFM